jgi:hypothetical protein
VPVPFSVWTKGPICGTYRRFATRRPHGDPFAGERFYRAFVIAISAIMEKRPFRLISYSFAWLCPIRTIRPAKRRRQILSAKSFGNQRRYLRLGQRGARMVEFARLWSSILMLNIDAGWRPPPPTLFVGRLAKARSNAPPALKPAA